MKSFSLKGFLLSLVVIVFSFVFPLPGMGGELKIIGVWDNSHSRENYKIIIAEEDDETIVIKKFKDGIRIRHIVIELQGVDGIIYDSEEENVEEYYIVDQAGNLQVWDDLGLKTTLKSDM